jgi:hypothetical protein
LTWRYYGPSLFWSWTWCSIYVIALGFIFLGRFLSGRWMTMSIIEPVPKADDGGPVDNNTETIATVNSDGLFDQI